jgi:hypothetical protein
VPLHPQLTLHSPGHSKEKDPLKEEGEDRRRRRGIFSGHQLLVCS